MLWFSFTPYFTEHLLMLHLDVHASHQPFFICPFPLPLLLLLLSIFIFFYVLLQILLFFHGFSPYLSFSVPSTLLSILCSPSPILCSLLVSLLLLDHITSQVRSQKHEITHIYHPLWTESKSFCPLTEVTFLRLD